MATSKIFFASLILLFSLGTAYAPSPEEGETQVETAKSELLCLIQSNLKNGTKLLERLISYLTNAPKSFFRGQYLDSDNGDDRFALNRIAIGYGLGDELFTSGVLKDKSHSKENDLLANFRAKAILTLNERLEALPVAWNKIKQGLEVANPVLCQEGIKELIPMGDEIAGYELLSEVRKELLKALRLQPTEIPEVSHNPNTLKLYDLLYYRNFDEVQKKEEAQRRKDTLYITAQLLKDCH